MTYNVFGGTLNLAQSINQSIKDTLVSRNRVGTRDTVCRASFVAHSRPVRHASPRPRLNMTKNCAVSIDVLEFSMLLSRMLLERTRSSMLLPCFAV